MKDQLFPRKGQYHQVVILSDFDGVISRENVLEALYSEFSPADWQHYVNLWQMGELSAAEEIPLCLGGVNTPRDELERFVTSLEIDQSFKDLHRFCNAGGYFLAITSDGLRWYIKLLLNKINVEEVPIFSNEIHFKEEGLTFSFPWYDPSTPLNGTSKATIVKKFQNLGYTVLYIGDGLSDLEAARAAEIVFAKNYLLDQMNREGKKVEQFEDFHQIINVLSSD